MRTRIKSITGMITLLLAALAPALVSAASAQLPGTALCEAQPTATCVVALALKAGEGLDGKRKMIALVSLSRSKLFDDLLSRSADRAATEALVRDLIARLDAAGLLTAAANLAGKLGDAAAAKALLARARQQAEAIADPHRRSLALLELAVALMRAGDTGRALAMVERLNTGAAVPVGTTIAECVPGPSAAVRPLLDEPPQRQPLSFRPGTPSATLKSLADIALERGNIAEALRIAKAITDPTQCFDALKALANARLRARDDAGAVSIANGLQNPWLRSLILREIVAARVFGGDRKGALDLARGIPYPEERYHALATIAEGVARNGDPAGALAIANAELPTDSTTPRLRPYAEIAVAFARKGDFPEARRILVPLRAKIATIPDGTTRAETLNHFARAYALTLDAEGFAEFVRSLDRQADQVASLALLASSLARAGKHEMAKGVLSQALAITAAITDAHERSLVDHPLVEAETATGDIAAARRRVAAMTQISQPLVSMVSLLIEARNHAEALRTANAITNGWQRVWWIVRIAESLAAAK